MFMKAKANSATNVILVAAQEDSFRVETICRWAFEAACLEVPDRERACSLLVANCLVFMLWWCSACTDYSTTEQCAGKQKWHKKNAVMWDNTPCDSCKIQRFRRTYHIHHQGGKNHRVIVIASVVPSLLILSTLMTEVRYSETSIFKRATLRHNREDDILYSHRCENLKTYRALTDWSL
jgi:hypothetical protein